MQKMNKKANINGKGADGEKQGADGIVKPIRPSKAMMDALESEGLHVDWPDDIFVELKGTFTTKSGLEHTVMLDFSYAENSVKTSADVDRYIAQCLYEAWMEYNWMYELKSDTFEELRRNDNLRWHEVIRVLEDCIQTERRLSRFEWVANCVLEGDSIPPKEQMQGFCETVHITPMMAGEIRDCLILAYPNVKDSPCAKRIKDMIDSLAWKLEIKESFNEKTGATEPRAKNAIRPFYKPMPQLWL